VASGRTALHGVARAVDARRHLQAFEAKVVVELAVRARAILVHVAPRAHLDTEVRIELQGGAKKISTRSEPSTRALTESPLPRTKSSSTQSKRKCNRSALCSARNSLLGAVVGSQGKLKSVSNVARDQSSASLRHARHSVSSFFVC